MKPWKVAALSALVLMLLMTWPFVRAIISPPTAAVESQLGGDFELVRQDGETVALSTLAGQGGWLTFMHSDCGVACEDELAHLSAQTRLPIIVVSTNPEVDSPERLAQWLGSRAQIIGLTGSGQAVARVAARYRLPISGAGETLDYPLRWYQLGAAGSLIKLWPAGVVLD